MPTNFIATGNNTVPDISRIISSASNASLQSYMSSFMAQNLLQQTVPGLTQNFQYSTEIRNIITANDVVASYVYDTRLDSDGGLWTEQCSGSSWSRETLNTSNRGSKRSFPKVALLVVRASSTAPWVLGIYDALDLDLNGTPRLWMSFARNATSMSSSNGTTLPYSGVFALNGRIFLSVNSNSGQLVGLVEINFANDTARIFRTDGVSRWVTWISDRDAAAGYGVVLGTGIINSSATGVHARVLPGAPIDLGNNLPIPTIALSTAGGISIIHPTGVISNITSSNGANSVFISETNEIFSTGSDQTQVSVYAIPYSANVASTSADRRVYDETSSLRRPSNSGQLVSLGNDTFAIGSTTQNPATFGYVAENRVSPQNGMVSYTSFDYSTGWMPGDVRFSILNRATTGNITGTANLLTNSDFSAGGTDWSGDAGVTYVSGVARLNTISGTQSARLARTISGLVVNESYLLEVEIVSNTGNGFTLAASSLGQTGTDGGSLFFPPGTPVGRYMLSFVAVSSTMHFQIFSNNGATATIDVDNVSLRMACMDHSFRLQGFSVIGTLQRTAVQSNTDVVGWSGFSGTNFLEQPYTSTLDFGTGDFCFMWWMRTTAAESIIWERAAPNGTGAGIYAYVTSGNIWVRLINSAGTTVFDGTNIAINDNQWHHVSLIRRNGSTEIFINGVLRSGPNLRNTDYSNTSARLRVGTDRTSSVTYPGAISMFRASAYAPSVSQIQRIFRDEFPLFLPDTRCFLGGNSNAVRSINRSFYENKLFVATNSGVSVFNGFVRSEYLSTTNASPAMASNTVLSVSSESGYTIISTNSNVGFRRETVSAVDRMDSTPPAFFARTIRSFGMTTNATPLILSPRIFVGEGETLTVLATFVGRTAGATDTQRITYRRRATFFRNYGGNVTLQSTVESLGTDTEVTASADGTLVIDTNSNTIGAQVTGVASTTIQWQVRFDIERCSAENTYEEVDA